MYVRLGVWDFSFALPVGDVFVLWCVFCFVFFPKANKPKYHLQFLFVMWGFCLVLE